MSGKCPKDICHSCAMISFIDALQGQLIDLKQPVVSDYTICVVAYRLAMRGEYAGEPLRRQTKAFSGDKAKRLIGRLEHRYVLTRDEDFSSSVFRVNPIADRTAEEVCALVDPFCYVSHLSAMARYGLTNRIPVTLTLTTLDEALWKTAREEKTAKDYAGLPELKDALPLKRSGFHPRIREREVARMTTKHPAQSIHAKGDSFLRIAGIGDVFCDMLSHPGSCGGMTHVLDVWREHAAIHLEAIIEAVARNPIKIVKVRAGYILDERLGIADSRIDAWKAFAQRGSSQVLNAEAPFSSHYSEKWLLSLNV